MTCSFAAEKSEFISNLIKVSKNCDDAVIDVIQDCLNYTIDCCVNLADFKPMFKNQMDWCLMAAKNNKTKNTRIQALRRYMIDNPAFLQNWNKQSEKIYTTTVVT